MIPHTCPIHRPYVYTFAVLLAARIYAAQTGQERAADRLTAGLCLIGGAAARDHGVLS